jgi:hypothetical protein
MTQPAKPQTLPVQLDRIPSCLKELPRWVGWRWEFNPDKPGGHHHGWDKPLLNPKTGKNAESDSPDTWGAYEQAVAFMTRASLDGIGVNLLGYEGIVVHDLDNCRNPETGEITPRAMNIIRLVGGYREITPSGTGIRGISWGQKTGPRVEASKGGPIDGAQYDGSRGRYVTLTGQTLPESTPDICEAHPGSIEAAYALMFPAKESNPGLRPDPRRVDADDQELLEKAFAAANGYKFKRLWDGGTSDYGDDDSVADMALCSHLGFWTGGDAARIDRLFRQSGLMRDKWDRRWGEGTYGSETIGKVLGGTTEFYSPNGRHSNGKAHNGHHSAAEEAFLGLAGELDSEEVQLHITRVADVLSEQVQPLWPKRIFQGKLAVMAGDPGVGKSYASLDIAARVSLGGPWPDGAGYAPQGNVLLLSAEDGLADTVKPRLDLLGADMRRIYSLGLTVSKGAEELGLSLQQHLPEIEQFIVENDIILLVVAPLLAFTGRVDTHKTAEVRGLLSPLAAMAERTGCAVLLVMHPNKNSQEGNPLYRISASLDFAAAARSVMLIAKHPDDPEQRVMATIKCNLTEHPEPMAFGFPHDGCFTWKGIADVDISRLLAPPVRDEDRNEREEAKDFLKTLLADGPVPATQVHQESKQLNISSRTLTRAKADLGIVSLCSGTGVEGQGKGRGKTATWYWRLPEHLLGTFKLATPPASTSGQLKNLEPKEHHADTKQGDIFKLATGNVKNPSPSTESSTNPPQSFKLANLKDGDDQGRDSLEV